MVCKRVPVAGSQSLMPPSWLAEAGIEPSGANATALTSPMSRRIARVREVPTSQSRTVASLDAVASVRVRLKARPVTFLVWPVRTARVVRAATSYSLADPSSWPSARGGPTPTRDRAGGPDHPGRPRGTGHRPTTGRRPRRGPIARRCGPAPRSARSHHRISPGPSCRSTTTASRRPSRRIERLAIVLLLGDPARGARDDGPARRRQEILVPRPGFRLDPARR